jgi:hypothetical protein
MAGQAVRAVGNHPDASVGNRGAQRTDAPGIPPVLRRQPAGYPAHLQPRFAGVEGTLLCCSPEGLAWLRRGADGDYAVDKEIRLGLADLTYSVAGETATELYLTLVDRTAWACLAIIEK